MVSFGGIISESFPQNGGNYSKGWGETEKAAPLLY